MYNVGNDHYYIIGDNPLKFDNKNIHPDLPFESQYVFSERKEIIKHGDALNRQGHFDNLITFKEPISILLVKNHLKIFGKLGSQSFCPVEPYHLRFLE